MNVFHAEEEHFRQPEALPSKQYDEMIAIITSQVRAQGVLLVSDNHPPWGRTINNFLQSLPSACCYANTVTQNNPAMWLEFPGYKMVYTMASTVISDIPSAVNYYGALRLSPWALWLGNILYRLRTQWLACTCVCTHIPILLLYCVFRPDCWILISVSRVSCKGGFRTNTANVPSTKMCASFRLDDIKFVGFHQGIVTPGVTFECWLSSNCRITLWSFCK